MNVKLSSDSTQFALDDENMFMEQEWKSLLEEIPYGPSAISLDISFENFDKLFGIPERINTFQINTTVDENSKLNENEPYRIYTSDHFNEKYPNHSTYGAVPIIHGLKEST